jgi:ABC-type amino acid transport substrate-binding protein
MHFTAAADPSPAPVRSTLFASLLLACMAAWPAAARGTLDQARESGRLTIGYLADAPPFAYTDGAGKPAGYAVALCSKAGAEVKNELKLPALSVDFQVVPFDERLHALEQGRIDILCGVEPTLGRRATMDFSIPILRSGTGVMIRADAPARLVQVLSESEPAQRPVWRATQGQAPERHVIAVISGTTVEKRVIDRLRAARIIADVVPVKSTAAGVQMVLERRAEVFFNDRGLLLEAKKLSPASKQLVVLDRLYGRTQVALGLRREDDAFRLVVDRVLSRLMRSGETASIYAGYFGAPDRATLDYFQLVALPD